MAYGAKPAWRNSHGTNSRGRELDEEQGEAGTHQLGETLTCGRANELMC